MPYTCAATLALTALFCLPGQADSVVVFNEILYHPYTNGPQEWVELHNQNAVDIDLSDWYLSGGAQYQFPADTIIAGHSYLVVAADPTSLRTQTGLSNITGPFVGQLANGGETLELHDNSGRLLDTLNYADSGDWPAAADGSGAALAKSTPDAASKPAGNWRASAQVGGTPGVANAFSIPLQTLVFNEVTAGSPSGFWVEVINAGNANTQLAGAQITCSGTNVAYLFPAGVLAPGACRAVTAAELGFTAAAGDKLFLYATNRTSLLDGVNVTVQLRGRVPDASGPWLHPWPPTPGATNFIVLRDSVVINEIMYHHRSEPGQPPEHRVTACRPIDAIWRYNQSRGNLGTGWRTNGYNDSAWASGSGLFYNVSSSIALPGPKKTLLTLGATTYYFRTIFEFTNDPAVSSFSLRPVIDDGAVFYLNGTQIYRCNMPSGTISWTTFASAGIGVPSSTNLFYIPSGMLVRGTNLLAVEVHQAAVSGSDVVFGTELYAETLVATGTPAQTSGEEWVELYNRGASAVNLAGWRLSGGIDYQFGTNVTLAADQYLLIANDAVALQTQYPAATILGNFNGRLADGGERIALEDEYENPADEVQYADRRPWPAYPDGGGCSLELRDPRADNSAPEVWAASDESSRSTWQTYTYRNTADTAIRPTNFVEFCLGLLDEGEFLLDDVSVIEAPGGAARQLIKNGTFETGAAYWRCTGNHDGSSVVADPDSPGNHALRVVSSGSTETMLNHIETTLTNGTVMAPGKEYEISFRAKWLAGSPRVHTRLYFNRVPRVTVLAQPAPSGTPGARNSRYQANSGPTFSTLRHTPVIPNAAQPVSVSVRAGDADGVALCRLWWSVNEGGWSSVAMLLSTGVYTATIPGSGAGSIVQFYAQAIDGLNATSHYPAAGVNSRALYVVQDGQATTLASHNFRIIMTASDVEHLHSNIYRFSDECTGCTIVYDEREAFYDTGIHLKGYSTRKGDDAGYTVRFNADQLFRGVHDNVGIDRSGRTMGQTYGNNSQEEIFTKQIANRAGHLLGQYDDIVHCIAPRADYTRSALLLMGRYGGDWFDGLWRDGADGPQYRLELVYYSTATIDGNPESPKQMPSTALQGTIQIDVEDLGDSGEWYRWHHLAQNGHAQSKYAPLVNLCKTFNLTGSVLDTTVGQVIDEDQWMRQFAYLALVCVFDTYNFGGIHHNVYYQRPEDGRMLVYPVDMDWAFEPNIYIRGTNAPLWASNGGDGRNLGKIITIPRNLRRLYGHVKDIVDTSFNPAYVQRWADHYYSLVENQIPFTGNVNFIRDRVACVARRLPAAVPFKITTNNGQPFSTSNLYAALAGLAWIDIKNIGVAGRPGYLNCTWATISNWSAIVDLVPGTNYLTLTGAGYRDQVVASTSIMVICMANVILPPLVVNELLALNTSSGTDEFGSHSDWIELYNAGMAPVSLSNIFLTDDLSLPTQWRLPDTSMPSASYLLIWADGNTNQGPLHAPFKLSGNGEQVGLACEVNKSTVSIQTCSFGPQVADVSYGLYPDGTVGAWYFLTPTPGASNLVPEPVLWFAAALAAALRLRRNVLMEKNC